jgi:alpha-tubulin suppressor-like RCC1 family protein
VSIGESFGIVMTEDKDLYTWGQNYNGQLGSGDLIDKPTPQIMQQITSEGRMLKQVSCGANFALCIGISTGLTVMDEQRIALEERIN